MSEPMIVEQMMRVARVSEYPDFALPKMTPVLHWTIDASTGRPVARWMIAEKRPSSALSLTA